MKAIHLVLLGIVGLAAFIFWRMLRNKQVQSISQAQQVSNPFDTTSSKGLCRQAAQLNQAGASAIGKAKGAPPIVTKAVGTGANLMVAQFCVAGSLLGKVAKPVIKAVEKGAKTVVKAVGKGTVVAAKESYKVVKSGVVGAGKEFKAITKSPTALVKSTPKLALAPIIAPTKVAASVAKKVADVKVPTAVTIVAAPVVVPTKVAAKAVTGTIKGAEKVASTAGKAAKKVGNAIKHLF
jgi:hypothetical protein